MPDSATIAPHARPLVFIDYPRPVPASDYEAAIARMCERVLLPLPGIRAVFQIGGVTTPGISDIDLVAVFDDDVSCTVDPLATLGETDRYLFVHPLYGCTLGQFPRVLRYAAFHNYRQLHGTALPPAGELADGDAQALREQIALEFMLRMYVNCAVQAAFGVVKLRGYLLQVKAIRYDLDFLGVGGGRLAAITDEIIAVRSGWFVQPADTPRLQALAVEFFVALEAFLGDALARHRLYLPAERAFRLAPNITLRPGAALGCSRRGLRLPAWAGHLGPRAIGLQHRLNRFGFTVPAAPAAAAPRILAERFELVRELRACNSRLLPHFMPLTSSLNI